MISEAYRQEQERLHINPDYGCASESYAPMISHMINKLGVTQLLDYGCGKARLMDSLQVGHKMTFQCYDPAIPAFSSLPVPMQMVTCIDVLEHVEPEYLNAVLDDLVRVTENLGFFTIATEPAEKTLSDGRNAHLIVQPMEWWFPRLSERFDIQTIQVFEGGFYVIVFAKPRRELELVH